MDHFHGLLFCSLDVIVQDMIPLFSWWAASSKRQSQNSIWPEYRGSPDFAQGKLLLFLAVGRNFLDTDQESNEAAAPSSCGTIFQLRVEPNANLENRYQAHVTSLSSNTGPSQSPRQKQEVSPPAPSSPKP